MKSKIKIYKICFKAEETIYVQDLDSREKEIINDFLERMRINFNSGNWKERRNYYHRIVNLIKDKIINIEDELHE